MTSGFGCKLTSEEVQEKMQPIVLNYWRVWDGPDAFSDIIAEYNKLHPNIQIKYRKLRYEEYEQALLEAWAEDRGPDIFSINATWVGKYQTKIAPIPEEIAMAYPVVKGTLKKEVIPEIRVKKSITLGQLKDGFLDTVYRDVVLDYYNEATRTTQKKIYGLPLSVDTLAMYYNKDLLNNAGITDLANFWSNEFQRQVKKLTKQDSRGNIIQAGVAMGTGSNIERSADLLAVLMMQNGATIINDRNSVAFTEYLPDQDYNPGLDAIRFYADFANPARDVYSWNSELDNSLNMFIDGKLAVMFGYAYHLPTIKAQAPKLNFSIKALPQIESREQVVNMADYWVETVSLKSKYIPEAWDFVQFATSVPDNAKLYLKATQKPTALRSLVDEQVSDNDIGVFANQLLTATSWYNGKNYSVAEQVMKEMLDGIAASPERLETEARIATGKIKQTL
ncbi:MAG: extracellular solute-binding protein [bacterium]